MARYYRWNRGGRYYGRNRYNYYYRKSGSTRSKSYGNIRAAKQQADQSVFTINIPSQISCFSRKANAYTGDGSVLNNKSLGVYAMNIFDQLRKSDYFNNYASMYDEFKIDRVKVKLLPTQWTINMNTGNYNYKNLTVYTAWDRSGLSNEQITMIIGKDYTQAPIPGLTDNSWVIGSENGTANDSNGTDFGGIYVTVGNDITTYSSAESRTVNPNTNTSIVRWLNPKTMQEKGQWISTGMLKPWYLNYDHQRGRYYTIPITDIQGLYVDADVSTTQQIVDIGQGQGYTAQKGILKQWKAGISDDNPCSLLEDQGIRFKPTLLVGIYPDESAGTDAEPANLIKFNVETEVVCSFRGLRKAKVVAAIENEKNPFVKNKLLDLTHLPAQPYSRQYNENDLLTEIERPNPNWHEGDPEDERYIIEYVDEGYTGFLPVNLQIENPNFVQLWGKEDNEGEISFDSLPITENGKYKFLFNDQSAFANGFIPVKRYDNETNDYDYDINISSSLYNPYPYESPLQITSNNPGIQSITFDPSNYNGLTTIYYTVNVPQSITTAYQLVYVKLYQQSRDSLNVLADIYLSNFQTNTTITISGDSTHRAQGGYFYYNNNNKQFGLTTTGTGSTNVTFNNGLYYLRWVKLMNTNRVTKMELYGNNGSSNTLLQQYGSNEYNYSFNVNSNILINI